MRRFGGLLAILACTAALAALPAAASAANLASGFDAGPEGWRIKHNSVNSAITQDPEWLAEGGNPGGFIRAADAIQPALWQAVAPSEWEGDKSANYGGSFSVDVRSSAPDLGPGITIHAEGVGFLSYHFRAKPTAWRSYSAPLTVADECWSFYPPVGPGQPIGPLEPRLPTEVEFRAVLAGIDEVTVLGELGASSGDVGDLDNIRLSEQPTPGFNGCADPPDFDGDGFPDENDACPAQFGAVQFAGCPPPTPAPPAAGPGSLACLEAQSRLAKAKEKLAVAASKKAKAKIRKKVKRSKERVKKACA